MEKNNVIVERLSKEQRHQVYTKALDIFYNNTKWLYENCNYSLCWCLLFCITEEEHDSFKDVKEHPLFEDIYYDGISMDKAIGILLPEFIAQKPKDAGTGDSFWFYGYADDNRKSRIKILKQCIELTK